MLAHLPLLATSRSFGASWTGSSALGTNARLTRKWVLSQRAYTRGFNVPAARLCDVHMRAVRRHGKRLHHATSAHANSCGWARCRPRSPVAIERDLSETTPDASSCRQARNSFTSQSTVPRPFVRVKVSARPAARRKLTWCDRSRANSGASRRHHGGVQMRRGVEAAHWMRA
jgi:hypothetical protein